MEVWGDLMKEVNKPSILEANILYFILGIILFFLGSLVQSREIYSGLLITEYLIILVPNLIFLKLKDLPLKTTLRLNKINLRQIIYIALIMLFSYPIAAFLNTIVITILNLFGETVVSSVPIPDSGKKYLLSLFVIGLSPGICEEIMFRGTIMRAYESMGKKKAIIYSSILFGIFHLNLQNLIGPIFLGFILATILYKTNSIYASMLGHGISNTIAMTLGYLTTRFQGTEENVQGLEIPYMVQLLMALLWLSIIALISSVALINLIRRLPGDEVVIKEVEEKIKLSDFFPIVLIIILFIIIHVKYLYL